MPLLGNQFNFVGLAKGSNLYISIAQTYIHIYIHTHAQNIYVYIKQIYTYIMHLCSYRLYDYYLINYIIITI